jgi:uncharacterized protein (TIGR02147 family)
MKEINVGEGPPEMPNIFDYRDYRRYLADLFEVKKAQSKSFSYRAFSLRAGLSSPSYLKMVQEGQRNLTAKTIEQFAKGLALKKREKRFFEALVEFNQCQDPLKKSLLFQSILKLSSIRDSKDLSEEQYEFLANWQNIALYVLIGTDNFQGEIEWIAKRLDLTQAQVQRALKLLESLDMIERDAQRGWRQACGAVSTKDEIRNSAVIQFHHDMIQRSLEALRSTQPKDREFNSATVSVSKENLKELQTLIRDFRKKVNEITSSYTYTDEVYQLNIHLFPITKLEN